MGLPEVVSFGVINVNEKEPFALLKKVFSALPVKFEFVYETGSPSMKVSSYGEVESFVRKHLEKTKKPLPDFSVEGTFVGEEVVIYFIPDLKWRYISLGIISHSKGWVKANKDKKEEFNRYFRKLVKDLHPLEVDYNTELKEMSGKINENGFIL